MYIEKDVKVISICELMEILFGKNWTSLHMSCEDETKAIKNWMGENDAHYYARPREDFFEFEAIREAIEKGKKTVIVEDMS